MHGSHVATENDLVLSVVNKITDRLDAERKFWSELVAHTSSITPERLTTFRQGADQVGQNLGRAEIGLNNETTDPLVLIVTVGMNASTPSIG